MFSVIANACVSLRMWFISKTRWPEVLMRFIWYEATSEKPGAPSLRFFAAGETLVDLLLLVVLLLGLVVAVLSLMKPVMSFAIPAAARS